MIFSLNYITSLRIIIFLNIRCEKHPPSFCFCFLVLDFLCSRGGVTLTQYVGGGKMALSLSLSVISFDVRGRGGLSHELCNDIAQADNSNGLLPVILANDPHAMHAVLDKLWNQRL